MKLMYAILTSKDINLTKRAVDSFGVSPVHIIVNTLDNQFKEEISNDSFFSSHIIVFTESTGIPGVGKQSLVDYFLSSDYTHLIQLDGDDILYPGSVDFIVHQYTKNNTNILSLTNDDVMGKTFFKQWSDITNDDLKCESKESLSPTGQSFFQTCMDLLSEKYRSNFFHRILMFDRHAAKKMNYNKVILGPDDLRLFCDLKLEYQKGNMKITLVEKPGVYLYDKRNVVNGGIRMNNEDAAREVVEEFFKGLTEDDLDRLRSTSIPVQEFSEDWSIEERKKFVLNLDQKYNISYE